MDKVRAKKHLGQHFLKNQKIAQKIAESADVSITNNILEVGPGMGVLTNHLLNSTNNIKVIELDYESIEYLSNNKILPEKDIINGDFLNINISEVFNGEQLVIAGNFPYNISSQIVFKILENKELIPSMSGMFQREVARRICSKEGSKEYGIISVLTQAYYDTEYLFTVDENEFSPPPKVKSGVMKMTRKENYSLPCNEKLFKTVIKTSFNQRRKTLHNSLKKLLNGQVLEDNFRSLRPEQLSVEQFISLTNEIESKLQELS